ncbi:MAG TPA: tRNA (N(6)-L-threonylcarbamoyladenosine(37)-C(2))-methylthiotransferase MtaB [Acidobacteria bacterium]|nr:tRNA (N(6)-L-threonylcarbamoyladenosine(37)-C(2))-methylthiotransferase MtaB [Acidobacteriota bacterium]
MRVRLETLGCRLNIGEMESLATELTAAGHRIVGPGDPADLCILNTCTVTATAARKSRHMLRRLRRDNPAAALVITGCWSQIDPGAARSTGAQLIVSNEDKDRLVEVLRDNGLLAGGQPVPADDATPFPGAHTRAFVKVQDGCDNRCAFCIVTVARGGGRSRPADDVVAEIRRLAASGYREAVLSGVHLGSWGRDLDEGSGLATLVRRVLDETPVERLRLSSVEPWDLDDRFFELWQDPRLLPHLHLPLQSGCDATLRRMARRTDTAAFARLVELARQAHPDMAVTTDVMAGFPGETEIEFEESLAFVEALAFARLHVFRYSRRPGTPAATMPGQVPGPIAIERGRRLHELGARLETAFQSRFLGRTMEVLWEESEPHGALRRWSGLTGNYLRVVTDTPEDIDLANRISRTVLAERLPGAIRGELAETASPGS